MIAVKDGMGEIIAGTGEGQGRRGGLGPPLGMEGRGENPTVHLDLGSIPKSGVWIQQRCFSFAVEKLSRLLWVKLQLFAL